MPSLRYLNFSVKRRKFDPKSAPYNAAEHEHGLLPPPIHVGKYLREKRIDFTLPYDVFFLNENNLVSRSRGG